MIALLWLRLIRWLATWLPVRQIPGEDGSLYLERHLRALLKLAKEDPDGMIDNCDLVDELEELLGDEDPHGT